MVDGHAISTDEVETIALRRYGQDILDRLIDNYLIDREANRLNIQVSQQEIDDEVQSLEKAIQPVTLEQGLERHHETLTELRDDFRQRLLGQKLAAIGAKPGNFVHVHYIALMTVNENPAGNTDADALALIAAIQKQLKSGEKFDGIIKQYNLNPSDKIRGGDMGILFVGAPFDNKLVEAALPLQPGEITEKPIKLSQGYFILEACSTDRQHPAEEDNLYADAKRKYDLLQGSRNLPNYLRVLRAGAKIDQYFTP